MQGYSALGKIKLLCLSYQKEKRNQKNDCLATPMSKGGGGRLRERSLTYESVQLESLNGILNGLLHNGGRN